MAPMPKVRTVAELYPPERSRELWNFLGAVATNDRDERGNFVLVRALVHSERVQLQSRLDVLAPFLTAGSQNAIAAAVLRMMLGFATKSMTLDEAKIVSAQYASALLDVPIWAVERACTRFATGSVRDSDLGEGQHWDRQFQPSTAHIRKIAVDLVRPFGEESTRLMMTLRGTVRKPDLTPEQHEVAVAHMDAALANLKRNQAGAEMAEAEADAKRQTLLDRKRREENEDRIREYTDAGLSAPRNADGSVRYSLPLALKMGWRIEVIEGQNVLVGPGRTTHHIPAYPGVTTPEAKTTARPVNAIIDNVLDGMSPG